MIYLNVAEIVISRKYRDGFLCFGLIVSRADTFSEQYRGAHEKQMRDKVRVESQKHLCDYRR